MDRVDSEQGRILASPVYQREYEKKLASGEYASAETKCICGGSDDLEVCTKDRMGLQHRIVLCKECALLRASPMMNKEAYRQFYNNEYRFINHSTNLETEEDRFANQVKKGRCLRDWLEEMDISTGGVVVDWGCYLGGMLEAFREKGATVYGIEWDEVSADFARSKGMTVFSSLDEFLTSGIKADLVIMQDVIEHLTELQDVTRLGPSINPDGYLFVYTPGFFRCDIHWYFQVAHTYQFCARTLEFVMDQLGYEEYYSDEEIMSIWQYRGLENRLVPLRKPQEWVEYIHDHLFQPDGANRKLPRFRGICKYSPKLLKSNITENLAQKIPDIHAISGSHKGDVIILGGGPSVDGQWETIRELHDKGIPIIAIARMNIPCLEHDIVPDYVLTLDCSPEQIKCFEKKNTKTTYLAASVTNPEIVKILKPYTTYIFDNRDNTYIEELRKQNDYEVATVINAGGSVTINAMSVAFNLGFDYLHVFGLDLMVKDKVQTHADGITGESVQFNYMTVDIKGKEIITTPSFVDFAQQTLDVLSIAHDFGFLRGVEFYGESLLTHMWDCKWHDEEAKDVSAS